MLCSVWSRYFVGFALPRHVTLAALLVLSGGATAQSNPEPHPDLSPVNLHLVTTRIQTGRWIWVGDSFAVPSRSRVSFSSLATWPLERIGAVTVGSGARTARFVPDPEVGREVTYEEGYVIAPGTPLESTMGLPLYRLLEWDLPAGPTDLGTLDVFRVELDDSHAAAHGGLFVGGASIRPLLYAQPGAEARGVLRMAETEAAESPLPLEGFALGEPAPLATVRHSEVSVTADLTAPGFVHLAGSILSGAPGHYAQFLGDASWSYWGYAQDGDPALPDSVKQFRTAHFADYLQATTLDPAQPTVVAVYLAQERRIMPVLQEVLQGVVNRTRASFQQAGLPEPVILFIHPHAIETVVVNDVDTNTRAAVAMRTIALSDPGVAFVSLYDATDGVVFDGRPEALSWLQGHALDRLSFGTHVEGQDGPIGLIDEYRGNLLDDNRLHPTQVGAAFYAYVLGQVLTEFAVSGSTSTADEPEQGRGGRLAPNPARPGTRVRGATAGTPVVDLLGRHLTEVEADGTFAAPAVPGIYLVGRQRLVVG